MGFWNNIFSNNTNESVYIEKDKFIEKDKSIELEPQMENKLLFEKRLESYEYLNPDQPQNKIILERRELDEFLNFDFGPIGYQDALTSADSSYCDSRKAILKYQLEIIGERVLTNFESKINSFNFHGATRKNIGMLDTVEEIESESKKYKDEIIKIKTILEESKDNKGKGQIIVLSYELGFKKGLAAITASKLFDKPIDK